MMSLTAGVAPHDSQKVRNKTMMNEKTFAKLSEKQYALVVVDPDLGIIAKLAFNVSISEIVDIETYFDFRKLEGKGSLVRVCRTNGELYFQNVWEDALGEWIKF